MGFCKNLVATMFSLHDYNQTSIATLRYQINLFWDGVPKVVYLYAEARFTCKWPNLFLPTQTQS